MLSSSRPPLIALLLAGVLLPGLLLLVQGCTVGPHYKPPVVPVPDNWRMPMSESSSLGNEKWWELLKDPVLQQMIRTALAHDSGALSHIVSVPSLVWTAVASLTQPIFTGGRLTGNLRVTQAQRQEALISYQSTVLTAFQEVNDALVAYTRMGQQLAAQEALVKAEQGALHLANLRYQGGVDTYLNVLTAEESLFTGEITLAADRGSVLEALVQLYQALGGGWQS